MSEKLYLLSEKAKTDLDEIRANRVIDLTSQGKNKRPAISSRGGGSSFTLFEVVKDTDTSVKINGYNVTEGRYSHNYIILGLSRVELADGVTVADIAVSGVIYIEVTYSGGYAASAKFAASLPAQDSTHIYHPLADIVCSDGKISQILQPPTCAIHYPGRVL